MSDFLTGYKGYNSNRLLSQNLWADCPIDSINNGSTDGIFTFDDFDNFGLTTAVASNVGRYHGGYKSFESNSCAIAASETIVGGAAELLSNGTDNDVIGLECNDSVAGPYKITAGSGPKLWFEARIAANAAWDLTAVKDLFVGMCTKGQVAAATTLFSNTAGTMTGASTNAIGFTLLNSGSALKTCLQATTNVRTAVAAQTLVVSTFYKVGFSYDPKRIKKIIWTVNGAEVDSATDDTIASFPTAVALNPMIILKIQATDAGAGLLVDWMAHAQLGA